MRFSLHSTQLFENIDADHGHLKMQPWHPVPCLTSASQMSSMLLAMTLFLVMCSYMKIMIVPLKQRGMSITSTWFQKSNKRVTAQASKRVEVCTQYRCYQYDYYLRLFSPKNGWFFPEVFAVSFREGALNFEPTFSSPLFCGGTHGSPQRISHPHRAVNADGRPTPRSRARWGWLVATGEFHPILLEVKP